MSIYRARRSGFRLAALLQRPSFRWRLTIHAL